MNTHRVPHSFFKIYNVSVYTGTYVFESKEIELGVLALAIVVSNNMKVTV